MEVALLITLLCSKHRDEECSRRRRGLSSKGGGGGGGGSTLPLLASVRMVSAVAVGAMSVLAKAASKLEGC